MADSNTVAIAAISLAGAIVAGFFALVARQDKTHQRIAAALDHNTKSQADIAKETKGMKQELAKGNDEAEARNGHLADLVISGHKQIAEALEHIGNQSVDEQVVNHQTIKKK